MILQSDNAAWVRARIGCLTGSRMADAMDFIEDRSADKDKDGRTIKYVEKLPKTSNGKFAYVIGEKPEKVKPSAARIGYRDEVLSERLAQVATDHYVTKPMYDGIEREPHALALFEAMTGEIVQPAMFVMHPHIEFFGSTPDGFYRRDRAVQVKCPTLKTYTAWLRAGVIPEEHKPQMIAELVCSSRRVATFIAYHPDMPEKFRLMVRDYEPTLEEIKNVEQHARDFLKEVDWYFDELHRREAA